MNIEDFFGGLIYIIVFLFTIALQAVPFVVAFLILRYIFGG